MKRVAAFVAIVLATLTVVLLLWQFRDVAVLFIFSLVVAAAVRPPIDYLTGRGLPRGLAMALTYVLSLAVIGGLLFVAGSNIIGELRQASDTFAAAYEKLKAQPPSNGVLGLLAQRLPPLSAVYQSLTAGQTTAVVTNALGITLSFFDVVSKVLVVLVLSIYWGSDQVHFERLWLSLLPAEQRSRARNIWRTIETGVGSYVRSEVIQGLLAGVVLGIGFTLLGMPTPVLLALAGAVAWFIPLLGGALAFLLAVAVGLLRGPLVAASAAACTLAVFLILEFVVERRLFDRRRYSSILTVLVMVALADALGVAGLLVAPPLAAAIQIFYRELMAQPAVVRPSRQKAGPQLDQLRERLANTRRALNGVDGARPELGSLMQRLETLVEAASTAVAAEPETAPVDGFARLAQIGEGLNGSQSRRDSIGEAREAARIRQ